MTKALIAALVACAGTAAMAAEPLGTLYSATGAVSVGGKGLAIQAKPGTPLYEGSTVMTPTGASAMVSLSEGCTIVLKQNQHLTINNKLTCGQMQASVKNLFQSYKTAQIGTDQSLLGGGLGGGGGLAGAGGALGALGGVTVLGMSQSNKDDDKSSPN